MRYQSFTISNYKGIDNLTFNFEGTPASPIFTLVGLNESGKTTILEALAYFDSQVRGTSGEKDEHIHSIIIEDQHSLIPKSQKHNFNGFISIKAFVILDDDDKSAIDKLLKGKGYGASTKNNRVSIELKLEFKASSYVPSSTKRLYDLGIFVAKTKKAKKLTSLYELDRATWDSVVNEIFKKRLQPINYYPNFLFDFPNKIYLEESTTPNSIQNTKEQKFYRKFVQDVLDSIGGGLTIQANIIDKLISAKSEDTEALDALSIRMASEISKIVNNKELNIFKDIKIEFLINFKTEGAPNSSYVNMRLKQGLESYDVKERSLGYRWFIIFTLLTLFRISRKDSASPLFLFDEPASNLHQTAQAKLLKALGTLCHANRSTIIYSTHSHHLINPEWLEGAYIVRNLAHDFNHEEDFIPEKTQIKIYKYRKFVGEYPQETTFYQPILDVLEYQPSRLEMLPNVVMVEGKNDYYTLRLIEKQLNIKSINFLPGAGSGNFDTPIQLYSAWGRKFIILLDSDSSGVSEKKRYLEKFGSIVESNIFTYADLVPPLKNITLEYIFTESERMGIQEQIFPQDTKYKKTLFNRAIQEMLLRNIKIKEISEVTADTFKNIFREIMVKLG